MVGSVCRVRAGVVIFSIALACKLEPPPAMEPRTEPPAAAAAPAQPDSQAAEATPATPPPADDNAARINALVAESPCEIVVHDVLKSGRAFWSGVGKYSCTYEIHINGARYKYTRLINRDRKRTPAEACERGRSSMESVVRGATRDCREMQVTDRSGQGLTPLR